MQIKIALIFVLRQEMFSVRIKVAYAEGELGL